MIPITETIVVTGGEDKMLRYLENIILDILI